MSLGAEAGRVCKWDAAMHTVHASCWGCAVPLEMLTQQPPLLAQQQQPYY